MFEGRTTPEKDLVPLMNFLYPGGWAKSLFHLVLVHTQLDTVESQRERLRVSERLVNPIFYRLLPGRAVDHSPKTGKEQNPGINPV